MSREIEVVKVYRIKGDARKYRTYKAVVGRLAWLIVFDKYGDDFDDYGVYTGMKSIPVGTKCNCSRKIDQPDFHDCDVHDRFTGYLRRLHDRLVNYIILYYPASHIAS